MSDDSTQVVGSFADLGLSDGLLEALKGLGYETPSAIQAQTIPLLNEGHDVLGTAQTGTGKTAAFALPVLDSIDLDDARPQALILAPTRELAIQVAEACQKYAQNLPGFHVLPIYGGQAYSKQLQALKRGVHLVVGTPGRVMDHINRGTLKTDNLSTLVLDEADEMLRMGFIDDVEWVLERLPDEVRIALFSATMPREIHRIAQTYLKSPKEVNIKERTATAKTITQRYLMVNGGKKLNALTRILEAEPFDGMIIFAKTKNNTIELAEKLEARGFAATALNGDIPQEQRERVVNRLKSGRLDILVATDVVARGLDVERISHVVNFDMPHDTESYVHRIGRTGRAGRSGEAILFVTPREKRMLYTIEKVTKSKIEAMEVPSFEAINSSRVDRFKEQIIEATQSDELGAYQEIISQLAHEKEVSELDIAAALAILSQGSKPLLVDPNDASLDMGQSGGERRRERKDRLENHRDGGDRRRGDRPDRGERPDRRPRERRDNDMESYRIEVGHSHGVEPRNIVGAIANEAGLDAAAIGRIDIQDDFSVVDLPKGMPKAIFKDLKRAWVSGQQLNITLIDGQTQRDVGKGSHKPRSGGDGKPPRRRREEGFGDSRSRGNRDSDFDRPRRSFGDDSDKPKRSGPPRRDNAANGPSRRDNASSGPSDRGGNGEGNFKPKKRNPNKAKTRHSASKNKGAPRRGQD